MITCNAVITGNDIIRQTINTTEYKCPRCGNVSSERHDGSNDKSVQYKCRNLVKECK